MFMVEQSHFFNVYVHTYIVGHFLHFAGNHFGSLALSERVRLGPEMKTATKGRKVLWLGGIL